MQFDNKINKKNIRENFDDSILNGMDCDIQVLKKKVVYAFVTAVIISI